MNIHDVIRLHASQPLPHQLLSAYLKKYKRPNDKIKALKDKGILETIKKGLYIAGSAVGGVKPDPFVLANHLLGPSYISKESALSYYGLIPERVYITTSVTIKPSRTFDTPAGSFTYTHLELPYYAFGINSTNISGDSWALIACPEKALCDKIVTTHGLILRSTRGAYDYLVDDLRIEESDLKDLNWNLIKEWLPRAPKKNSLLIVLKMIEKL